MPKSRKPLIEHVQLNEPGDRTPSCIVIAIYAHEFEAIKEHTAQTGISLRAFFSEAYSEMIKVRKEWTKVNETLRYPWRASPKLNSENDEVILVYVWLPMMECEDLREVADFDETTLQDAAYTAATQHMRR